MGIGGCPRHGGAMSVQFGEAFINHKLSIVNYKFSIVNYKLSIINRQSSIGLHGSEDVEVAVVAGVDADASGGFLEEELSPHDGVVAAHDGDADAFRH